MVNSSHLQQWQFDAVHRLLEDGHDLVLSVVRTQDEQTQSLWSRLTNYPYNNFLYRFWQRFLFRPAAKQQVDISHLLAKITLIPCRPEIKGHNEWIPEQVAQAVSRLEPDFLLRFGFNIIRGSLLNVPKYGIWSFHHDDEQIIRGGPPGFWEVFYGHQVNGVILQRLTEKLDGGPVLDKIWLPVVGHSYKAHLNNLLTESAFMPARVCRSIALNGMRVAPSEKPGKIYRKPVNSCMLRFFLKMPMRRISFHLQQLFRQESWRIGIITTGVNHPIYPDGLQHHEIQWITHPDRAQYYADPFVVRHHGKTIILAEHFDYSPGKGNLVRLIPEEGFRAVQVSAPDSFHRSFPFLLPFQDKVYCIPECYASRQLTLFTFDPEQNRLHEPQILLSDFEAIDPILFENEGLWWLMCSQKRMPGVQLFAWYAEKPQGPFRPHPLNPLITDPRSARNAGAPFLHNGQLIRPAQDVAGAYGKAVVFKRVDVLSTSDYRETVVGRLEPENSWEFHHGLHTFNSNNKITLIDAKTYRFSLAGLRHVWKLKTKRSA